PTRLSPYPDVAPGLHPFPTRRFPISAGYEFRPERGVRGYGEPGFGCSWRRCLLKLVLSYRIFFATWRQEPRQRAPDVVRMRRRRSEEHTSELQSRENLVCRLLLEKKK